MNKFSFTKFILTLVPASLLIFVLSTPPKVAAQTNEDFGVGEIQNQTQLGGDNLITIISRIINVFLGLLGIIALVLIIYGGYKWMTAGGNEEQITEAKRILINATIGLAIILSSFAISNFVLNQFSEATQQTPTTGGPGGPGQCPSGPCVNIGGGQQCDPNEVFYVQSITPSTEANDQKSTHMKNVKVRAVFSQPPDQNSLPTSTQDWMTIEKDGSDITSNFSISLEHNRHVMVAKDTLLDPGDYEVSVNEEIKGSNGGVMGANDCGVTQASFRVSQSQQQNQLVKDEESPKLRDLTIGNAKAGQNNAVYAGDKLRLGLTVDDRTSTPGNYGGNAFVELKFKKTNTGSSIDTTDLKHNYVGPTVDYGSSDPFNFSFETWLRTEDFATGTQYTAKFTAYDIDSKRSSTSTTFTVYPSWCNNPSNSSTRGCAGGIGASCKTDSDCKQFLKCINKTCTPKPIISSISPTSGDKGTWVTIKGKHFGATQGSSTISLAAKSGSTANTSALITMPQAQCSTDTWNDTWILAQIPSGVKNQEYGVVLENDKTGFTETTYDNNCSKSQGSGGFNATCESWFEVNNTSRPGICEVADKSSGNNSAVPGSDLTVKGRGFQSGNTNVFFNTTSIQESVSNVSSTQFDTTLPQFQPSTIDVFVTVQGNQSNSVPFRVVATSSAQAPTLESIDPTSTTKESYVTIFGNNFGSQKNEVYMHPQASQVRNCFANNKPNNCIQLQANLPQQCGDTWGDDQIIVQVPDGGYSNGLYNIAVEDAYGNITDGQDTLEIISGAPRPGLCSISPDSGPAPLASDSPPLSLYGANIETSPTPTLYFWQDGAVAGNVNTWISSVSTVTGTITSNNIDTRLPTTTNGKSMQSGPIKLENNNTGQISNGVQYSVQDCRDATQNTKSDMNNIGYRCCESGPEAGTWKTQNLLCEGQTRNAGYAWRFATAEIPKLPVVEEQCQQTSASLPSPTPRPPTTSLRGLDQGKRNVCINANIQTSFNVTMDSDTINSSTVQLLECEDDNGGIDCSNSTSSVENLSDILQISQNKLNSSLTSGGSRLEILKNNNNNPKLKPATWYRVILSDDLRSFVSTTKANRTVTSSYPLQRTRPCGEGTAYCFDFRTSNAGETCNLDNAAVDPTSYTAESLGSLMNSFGSKLWYQVIGKADQACTVINTEGFDWSWGQFFSGTSNPANNYVSTTASTSDYLAEAFINKTTPRTIDITATTSVTTSDPGAVPVQKKTVSGTSKLDIDLGTPRVSRVWPTRSCVASCPNAPIGAEFTRQMIGNKNISGSYDTSQNGNIIVERCSGELCQNPTPISIKIAPSLPSDKTELNVRPQGQVERLTTSTWYQVTLKGGGNNGLKAIGGFDNQIPLPGKSLVTTTWKFKTKDSMQGCRLNSVDVDPSPYAANTVGDKQPYQAVPRGSPNECNPKGQVLNPSNYNWNWKSNDPDVVTTTNFRISDEVKPFCRSDTCLLNGSEITSTSTPICGNGQVEAGEDCDIAENGETSGQSCDFNCLRPGNKNTGTSTNQCGNGTLDWEYGEECELIDAPNTPPTSTKIIKTVDIDSQGQRNVVTTNPIQNADQYCDPTSCLNLGSPTPGDKPSGVNTNDIPVCLSGDVTPGEDCDPASSGPRPGCSNSCLNQGTELSEKWCRDNVFSTSQQATSTKRACRNSVSICGNGTLEPSEECEVNFRSGQDDQLIFRDGKNSTSSVTTTGHSTCNESCLLTDICADKFEDLSSSNGSGNFKGNVDPNFALRCDPSKPGCSPNCRLAGSSVVYPNSSVCGDANVGTGEYSQCEVSQSQISDVFGNPVQVSTAEGQGEVKGEFRVQTTTVVATTSESKDGQLSNTIQGEGEYNLQCGFETFDKKRSGSRKYNSCSVAPNKDRYEYGVADNSCCYKRAQVSEKYPADKAGVTTTGGNRIYTTKGNLTSTNQFDGVCRNTQIHAEFPTYIDRASITDNIIIARKAAGSCSQNERDISTSTNKALAINKLPSRSSNTSKQKPKGFWQNLWHNVKSFFTGVFNKVFAAQQSSSTWCQGGIEAKPKVLRTFSSQSGDVTTTIRLQLNQPLASNTTYAVIYKSGIDGIKDSRGVGVMGSSSLKESLDVAWKFKTKDEICKVQNVNVQPDSYLYEQPNSSTQFTAVAKDNQSAQIQPTSFYDWRYDWGPTGNPAFEVPNSTSTQVRVTSTAEGEMKLRGSVIVTKDDSQQGAQAVGTKFSDQSSLTAAYCKVRWPTSTPQNWKPYTNDVYNFSFDYCSDAGNEITESDDLPLLKKGPTTTQLRLFSTTTDLRGQLNNPPNQQNNMNISKLKAEDNILIVSDGNNDINSFNTSDKRNPKLVTSTSSNVSPVGALTINSGYLYVFAGGTNEVDIYEIGTQGGLQHATTTGVNNLSSVVNNPSSVSYQVAEAAGSTIFAGTSGNGVIKIDVSASTNPQQQDQILSTSGVTKLDIDNNKLAALDSGNVSVFDLNDLSNNSSNSFSANDIALTGDTLAALGNSNIQLFDVSDPTGIAPTINTTTSANSITTINENLVALNPNPSDNIDVFDISSPYRFRTMFNDSVSYPLYGDVYSYGKYAYSFFSSNQNIQIINLSDPSSPSIPLPSVRRSILDKKLFLNDKNEDALGVQIFTNPKKKDVRQWHRDNFGGSTNFRSITVDGYSGITNGTEYYISALNVVSTTPGKSLNSIKYNIYYNIYNFNINRNANEKTKQVLSKIIDNLTFNTNLDTGSNQCLDETVGSSLSNQNRKWSVRKQDVISQTVDVVCDNDFQCRDSEGIPKLEQKEELLRSSRQVLNSSALNRVIATTTNPTNEQNISAVTSTLNNLIDDLQKDYNSLSIKKSSITSSLPINNNISIPQDFNWVSNELSQNSAVRSALKSVSNTKENDLNWTNGYCANVQDKLKRDWQRLRDVTQMQRNLEDEVVPMDSGSYIPHYTNSNWPSWQTLSRRAGSPGFPVDPINNMVGCDRGVVNPSNIDPTTCWNPVSSTFHYPEFSKMYEYRYNTTTEDYQIYTDLEFLRIK